MFEALALHCVQVPGAEHASHPERHTGVSHWLPVYPVPVQSHVQSAFCAPLFWHCTEHTHAPLLLSHCPNPAAQVLPSQNVWHVVP